MLMFESSLTSSGLSDLGRHVGEEWVATEKKGVRGGEVSSGADSAKGSAASLSARR